jgi:hypothetical protein
MCMCGHTDCPEAIVFLAHEIDECVHEMLEAFKDARLFEDDELQHEFELVGGANCGTHALEKIDELSQKLATLRYSVEKAMPANQ